ncbi:hypothetical protein C8R47DRAFT_1223075 [Mycena vitilis]|nr:hypothetical protein C8R47DRAFT_1223075 [Mycena vitilis]
MSSNRPQARRVWPMFGHARSSCLAGYYDVPNVSTAMSFNLAYLERINSRIVRIDGRVFELWSPNSSQRPFLAGERRDGYLPLVSPALAERRYDGHSGRHDCLYVPQYFRADVPHWPYVRRASEVPLDDPVRPAFTTLSEVWIVDLGNRRKGHLDTGFLARLTALSRRITGKMEAWKTSSLWSSRPQYACESRVQRLAICQTWDEVVDLGVALQRGLREQEAWLVYMQTRRDQHRLDLDRLRGTAIPEARERFIGIWLNGLPEMAALRYLVRGVPCFIVHEYLSSDVPRAVPDSDTYTDFVSGTGLVLLLGDENPYQGIAREQGCLDALINGDDGRGPHVLELAVHERRSSSVYLEDEARRRASITSVRPDARRTPALPASPAEPSTTQHSQVADGRAPLTAAPQESGPSLAERKERTAPSLSNTLRDRFAAPELELRALSPYHAAWIVPPPLIPNWTKKWSKWELAEVNHEPAWLSRASSSRISASSEWFDRQRGRRLFFGKFRPAAGLLDWERFGAPVPRHPFFTMDGERAVPQPPSHWMYPNEKVAPYNVGKKAATPREEGLSRLGRAKGKGKANQEAGEEEEEEEEDEYGMDIDEVASHPPSNVVVVGGLDDSTSALMFRNLSSSALFRSSARPLSIIRAQGRMWLRFADVTEGRRAFGALGSVAYGLEVAHRSDAEFREAYGYTRDIWDLELEKDELNVPLTDSSEPTLVKSLTVPSALEAASTRAEAAPTQRVVSDALHRLSLSPQTERAATAPETRPAMPVVAPSAVVAPALARPTTTVQDVQGRAPAPPPSAKDTGLRPSAPLAVGARLIPVAPARMPPSEPRAMRSVEAQKPFPQRDPLLETRRPLEHRLKSPAPSFKPIPRVNPLSSLETRLSDFPQSFFERIEDAREGVDQALKRAREYGSEEEDLAPTRPQTRKKKRGSRAGKLAKEQKLEKEARRANAILRELAEAHEQGTTTQVLVEPSRSPAQPVAGPSDAQYSPAQPVAGPSRRDVDMEDGELGWNGWDNDVDDGDERPYAARFFK